jgi:predicted phosphodiesterase
VAEAGVDLLLAGHNHRASTHHAKDLVTDAGPALVIQAGTATSTRLRDEEQSFNLLEVGNAEVTVTVQAWDGNGYASSDAQRFVRRGEHWETATGEHLAEAPEA